MTTSEFDQTAAVAIIGLACRVPGARTPDEFWRNLCDGVESATTFSDEQLAAAGVPAAEQRDPRYVRTSPTLDDIELFDAAFFGLNPKEAEATDPQHRLFLECVYETLERAGYTSETYQGAIGLYAGASLSSYLLNNLYPSPEVIEALGSFQVMIGNDKDYLTSRVAYKLNLRGPAVTVQTACSTSLAATHLACQSLLQGECDMALAGGVAIRVPSQAGYLYQEGGILSPDGHCRAYAADAQGTVGGSGVGVVLLKRLADAVRDDDTIYAVIRGSAMNNDGAGKVGYTAPSVTGQAAVLAEALSIAGVAPETIGYVEGHGTGTALGDPIEVAALRQAFRSETAAPGWCALGSVKTNIGHLDAAAGVIGLIKATLAIQHGQIPPSLHAAQPNPALDLDSSPFRINTELRPWLAGPTPRRAGVSSFGIGGTNVHVVLEEAPARAARAHEARPWQLLTLSARSEAALQAATANLHAHLDAQPELALADACYTQALGRKPFSQRRFLVCRDRDAALAGLAEPSQCVTGQAAAIDAPLVMLFSGQGSQYVNMGRELYEQEPFFREQIDRCAALLMPHLGLDLRTVLYPAPEQTAAATERLTETALTQPALFVIEYALARLWRRWGVRPAALIGHSIGEYVAATLAGVFSLEDALALVALRGRLMQSLPSGAMLSVHLSEAELLPLLGDDLALAAVNGPQLCVVAGPHAAVDRLRAELKQRKIGARALHTSHAFHSHMMEPILAEFTSAVAQTTLNAPRLRYISNVSGDWITPEQATDPRYWASHLRRAVRFADGVAAINAELEPLWLEVGPGRTLSTLVRQQIGGAGAAFSSLPHPQDQGQDQAFLLGALGKLWVSGISIGWARFYSQTQGRRVALPTYPFERKRFWVDAPTPGAQPAARPSLAQRRDLQDWFYLPTWKPTIAPQPTVIAARRWLILLDQLGLGQRLAQRLREQGQPVTTVASGAEFVQWTPDDYAINPDWRDDYQRLVAALRAGDALPETVVHLWGVDVGDAAEPSAFSSLIALMQMLGEHHRSTPLQIELISSGMQQVSPSEPIDPLKATLLGACLSIPQEYPDVACRSIDVALPSGQRQIEQIVERLLAELAAPPAEPAVAYRSGQRLVQRFEPVALAAPSQRPALLRERGVYLITGGLGGIGLALAEYLVETVQARLVLVGRRALPERAEWAGFLAGHDHQDRISAQIRAVQRLEALGAETLLLSADVTDERQLREAAAATRARFGAIHGIIHAAGVAGGGLLQLKTPEQIAATLAPKLRGAPLLAQVFQDDALDFMLLTSSLTALLGGFGQVDYCAANAFLDAFAREHARQSGIPTIAVNWDAWSEVGMAVNSALPEPLRADHLQLGIRSDEGRNAFARILAAAAPQIAVSTRDLHDLVRQQRAFDPAAALASWQDQQQRQPTHPRPLLSVAYVAPASETERTLAQTWGALLGIEQIGVHDDFFELGGHSLLAIQLISRIREGFNVDLQLRQIFEAPTIAALSQLITGDARSEQAAEPSAIQAVATGEKTLGHLVAEIEHLSKEEVLALLAAKRRRQAA